MYDLILRNGTLYDVSRGLRGEVADIAIENGVIRKLPPTSRRTPLTKSK